MKLYQHQIQGLEIARKKPRFCFFWDPGTGKTILCLAIQKERPMRTLVVAQKSIIWTAWEKDAEALGVPLKVAWHRNKTARMKLIEDPGNHVLVTNYEQFRTHYKAFQDSGVERVIFDESSKLKNRKSKTSKAAHIFSDRMKEVYLLSGTPAPNCPTEFWSQLRACNIDHVRVHEKRGPSFWDWTGVFFVTVYEEVRQRKSTQKKKVVAGFEPKETRSEDFIKHLRGISWALRKQDCLDLPEQVDVIRQVELSSEEKKAYARAKEQCRIQVSAMSTKSFKQAGMLMKLRQITGGFVHTGDTANPTVPVGDSRLKEFMEWNEEVATQPVVVWAEFRHEIFQLRDTFEAMGVPVSVVMGGMKDTRSEIEKFIRGETKRLIANPQAAGHGTDGLQTVCHYAAFYSLSFSAEFHEQSRDRIHRSGQGSSCTYVYFIAPGTVDVAAYKVVKRKMRISDAILSTLGLENQESKR